MAVDLKVIQRYAESTLGKILENCGAKFESSFNKDTGALTIKVEDINVCGYSVLSQFMFMKDGEVYFFTLFDELDITAENAALAFEASTTTPIGVTIDDYLTLQLGAYLFREEDACLMIERYFDDMIYLLKEDESIKTLLSRMH